MTDANSRASRLCILAAGAFAASGCFAYRPAPPDTPLAGTTVRLHLTAAGSAALQSRLGADATLVEGRVRSATDSALLVAVRSTTRGAQGYTVSWNGDSVTIPRAALEGVEVQALDGKRTTLLAAGAVLGVLVTRNLVRAGNGGGSSPGGTPGPPAP